MIKHWVPAYLQDSRDAWQADPRNTNLKWFQDAGFGLFLHFSPASVLDGGADAWKAVDVTFQRIHERFHEFTDDQYEYWMDTIFTDAAIDASIRRVWDRFRPDQFDADRIAALAVAAGMKYITFTTRHVMGRLFLFKTRLSPCNSVDLPPHRDFVAELAGACRKHHLGLFLYVMPPFDDEKERVKGMLTELLQQYGPIAGIWFDGISRYYSRPDCFADISRKYHLIRSLQPGCLISFKTGATGEEDFIAPEWQQCTYAPDGRAELASPFRDMVARHPRRKVLRYSAKKGFHHCRESCREVWETSLRHKPLEICTTMQEGNNWFNCDGVRHRRGDEVLSMLTQAHSAGGNLLLNAGPRGDGSMHPEDETALRETGERLHRSP